MTLINELDEAQVRHEMRDLYKKAGYDGSLQALYEIMVAGRVLAEVIMEETHNGNR